MRKKIGVVGTGFIGTGLINLLQQHKELAVGKVLTRRNISTIKNIPRHLLTNSVDRFLDSLDLIVECSGDVLHGSYVINEAMKGSLPVVTMNSELQITTGTYFAQKGFITEAEGDQPGSIAALRENVMEMGFTPLVYGNIKGYLNENPTPDEMAYWSKKNGISLGMVTSFTDGTKVNIEQVLVANGLNGALAKHRSPGIAAKSVEEGGNTLAADAKKVGLPISDYILCSSGPPGVFITAEHNRNQAAALNYLKMGQGPYYTILQNHHLCHLEIIKTIKRVLRGGGILLNNSTKPTYSVGATAKRTLSPGDRIEKGIGSFDVRGTVTEISKNPDHIPIGLLSQATLKRTVKAGEELQFDDVTIPQSIALEAWRKTVLVNGSLIRSL
ncbi:NAD(P)-dependent oxidoreductase [Alkalihalobacillus sp. CinArs1]|uniref:NAD(P)-dependent oxidoreductase n=1 Tax=Alkalihalobacillus sp. CinArs1 TaxID=2995314 RepID=UPI0022DCEE3C|nr:NAD(P)-dependent oxidoreductase [Alkalihalobacillus sp. CinArs1]